MDNVNVNKADELKSHILEKIENNKEFVQDVDGFYYWWPEGLNGYLTPHALRWIADELDRRNKNWEDHIMEYFHDNP